MNFNVEVTVYFKKQAKHLIKKYPSLKVEIISLIDSLAFNPGQGTSLGKGCFKIRIPIASKGKGKSGGARIITYVQIIQLKVYLLTIYDKSEIGNLSEKELKEILKTIPS
jgi:hypothetical protein